MNTMEIDPTITEGNVKEKIAGFLKIPAARLEDKTPLARLIADSFVVVELLVDLQEEFGISLRQEELKTVVSLGDLVTLIVGHSVRPVVASASEKDHPPGENDHA